MKVFVYDKKSSKKVAEIKKVVHVQEFPSFHSLQIISETGEIFEFDTRFFKTTAYQN